MKLIVGLGNPGDEYQVTRHNTGYLYIEHLLKKYNVTIKKEKFNSLIYEHDINNEKVYFVKPTTYMNLSGEAVLKIKEYYKIDIEDILIIYDDIDLDFGNIRYRKSGSPGTHNGMKNIIKLLNDINVHRIRIGIGKPKFDKRLDEYVLSNFSKEEFLVLNEVFTKADEKLLEFLDK